MSSKQGTFAGCVQLADTSLQPLMLRVTYETLLQAPRQVPIREILMGFREQ